MAFSCAGLTIFACLPCMLPSPSCLAIHSYVKYLSRLSCDESPPVSRGCPHFSRVVAGLPHILRFPYECLRTLRRGYLAGRRLWPLRSPPCIRPTRQSH